MKFFAELSAAETSDKGGKQAMKMFLTIARLAGSIATGIVLNWLINYLKKKKIRKEIQNDRK